LLFGYEKGAFTSAYQSRAGKFEQAQGGTLLLDEITEMDKGLQSKLLRVLQEKEVERLGGRHPISLDVRVIATSNRDLAGAVMAGEFREDLYYRLNVFPLHVPPLRERPQDILPLARRFLARYVTGGVLPELAPSAVARLQNHGWPGNVRELENVVQRALVLRVGDCRHWKPAAAGWKWRASWGSVPVLSGTSWPSCVKRAYRCRHSALSPTVGAEPAYKL